MSKNKQEKISIWSMFKKLLPQIFSVSPKLFILTYVLFLLNGTFFASSTLCTQIVFDSITKITNDNKSLKQSILAVLLLFTVKVLEEVFSGLANFIAEIYDPQTVGKLSRMVNLKIDRLEPICFENPEILDDINKSYLGIKFAINFINTIMDTALFYLPYFLFMGIYLFRLKPTLALSLILVFLPVLFSQIIRAKIFSKLEGTLASLRRKNKYYETCLVHRDYLKETRMLGACPYFIKIFKDTLMEMNSLKWSANLKTNLLELIMKLLSLLGYLGILWMLFKALINQEITVGAFAAVFASVDSMFNMMEDLICGRLGYYAKNFGKVQNYLRFLDLPEKEEDNLECKDIIHGDIKLQDVTFNYPSSQKNALENINLTINKGETIAIVGENGSGKSTLIRLIIGLYNPTKGKVLHNNIDISNFTCKTLFSNVSSVFQKYQKYQLALRDNIIISEMDKKNKDDKTLKDIAINANLKIDDRSFPNGYDTMLSREFNGVDLSGGQWQRVAIARGLYRNHGVIVLDEPTAAIDPIEETKLYENFANISKDKTAIIVTHRLGSIKFVDRIVVMKDGKIIGVGNHKHLLSNCSIYSDMWNSQAHYYKKIRKVI